MTNYTYKFRLYPDREQFQKLKQFTGSVRFVYNKLLAISRENKDWNTYRYKKLLPELKQEYPFLKEAPSQALQEAVFNIGVAYENFFKKKAGFPAFKKKKNGGSIYLPQGFKINKINDKWSNLYIPKLKNPIKLRTHRKIEGQIKAITIRIMPSGSCYAMILVKKEIEKKETKDKITATDMGLKDFATLVDSNGNIQKIPHPKYLTKTEKRLKKQQKKLSRKQKFSKNFFKQAKKVARLHEKVKNQRLDFLHKLSSAIISENQAIVVEDLNIKGMVKNNKLSKSISDSGWGYLKTMLEYKAVWYGRELIVADRFYPSSKLCSNCGYLKKDLQLLDRYWICPMCKTYHDRDINAAKNLLQYGFTYLIGGRAGTVQTNACGDSSVGGLVVIPPVYETPVVEAGSLSFQ
ncbi:RNA-guided endonuclease TnpB family protein [Thermodesulfovibrio sp. 1176]|uniref:RNA-guided endonuclease TnpB family protein n=1 Tax=Thermodesulfovibrio sp. 1176 TaxID=3043424 RepID=UPI0024825251|nr:RNA-guided endonuclease TnpB family protein [Thermodesulfovibrio sp. 1176]MDI1472938.1 RNA-guided endonuclease TnpB family protein [Thermodesulfovibrio sp. 1176]